MLIHELAARADIAAHTIRFYEREGLLDERYIMRGVNNYRHYTEAAVERLAMIREGQSAGFTLSEIKELIAAWDAGDLSTTEQTVYLRRKISDLDARIAEMERLRLYLTQKLIRIEGQAQPDRVATP